jgi:L-2-hydroxyglutarate oxidase
MDMMRYDVVIIGGGIVGLATAMLLKKNHAGLRVALLEKEKAPATHQTGNNSGVIHSGLYYKPGSLKATNCLKGYRELLKFCNEEGIAYDLCGKTVVATSEEELPRLENLYRRGLENGLVENRMISAREIKDYEPNITGLAGIWVPYTGIVDYGEVSRKYASIFTERYGGEIHLGCRATAIKRHDDRSEVTAGGKIFEARLVVNTAGLYCDRVAIMGGAKPKVRIIPFRGEYYELAKDKHRMINHLVYPVPDPAFPFLGVHYTRKIAGGVEAGPNAVFAFRREGYKKTDISVSETLASLLWPGFIRVMWKYWRTGLGEYYRSYSKRAFTRALQKLSPGIQAADLAGGGAGVRAQACTRDGQLIDDFMIEQDHLMIHILNAPSPAATASLAIGETIAGMIARKLSL